MVRKHTKIEPFIMGLLSGMSMDRKRFIYVNPLKVWPKACGARHDHEHVMATRQEWFGCACCPPNIARLLASIGEDIYSQDDNGVYVHLYTDNKADLQVNDSQVILAQSTEYPWDERINITVSSKDHH